MYWAPYLPCLGMPCAHTLDSPVASISLRLPCSTGSQSRARGLGFRLHAHGSERRLRIEGLGCRLVTRPVCPVCLQEKLQGWLVVVEQGRQLSTHLKESRDYKNPTFLQKAVETQHIDQYGSAYPRELFDPHSLNPEVRRSPKPRQTLTVKP